MCVCVCGCVGVGVRVHVCVAVHAPGDSSEDLKLRECIACVYTYIKLCFSSTVHSIMHRTKN